MYPITLYGRAVTLREFRSDDAADAYALIGDDEVTQWLSFDTRSLADAQAMVDGAAERAKKEPRDEYYLGVTLADDKIIGFARLALGGVKAAKLGYAIRADQWGHGYATDAVKTIVDFGFNELGLHRITAAIGPDNSGSITVVEKLGFSCEGTLRDHVYTNGSWRDSRLYSILETPNR